MAEPGSTEMRDRGAFGWAARTGRGGDGRAEARPFTPRSRAHRPGAGPEGAAGWTGSGLASPDGRTARADRWIQAESDLERNKRNVVAFFTQALNDGEPEAAAAAHLGSVYIQHNPVAPDGVDAFVDFVRGLAQQLPEARVEIKRVVAEGDLVALHSHFTPAPGERGSAVVDIFRLDGDGKIVEHWDVAQDVPESSANDNGMF